MSNFEYPPDPVAAFRLATVFRSDLDAMRTFCDEEPHLFRKFREQKKWVVCEAARRSSPEAVRTLIELGADVDEQDSNGWTGLCWAVARGRHDVVKVLLECRANPDLNCPLFEAASEEVEDPVAMTRLLLDYGAKINQPIVTKGLPLRNVLSEAIAVGRRELVEFLKSRGAQVPGALPAGRRPEGPSLVTAGGDYIADVLAHFRKHFGKPDKRAVREIVPMSANPVTVHNTKPSPRRRFWMLFTIGVSRFEMPVPEGAEQYRRAELMVALPNSWPAPGEALKHPRWAWPIQWLRKIAAYPVENNTWLGGPWTVLSNEEPPQPLGPATNFTAWVLASPQDEESVVKCKDGAKIQLYRLFPLYTEEYLLEREHGIDALMSQIERHGFPEYIDLNRPNVALS